MTEAGETTAVGDPTALSAMREVEADEGRVDLPGVRRLASFVC